MECVSALRVGDWFFFPPCLAPALKHVPRSAHYTRMRPLPCLLMGRVEEWRIPSLDDECRRGVGAIFRVNLAFDANRSSFHSGRGHSVLAVTLSKGRLLNRAEYCVRKWWQDGECRESCGIAEA